MLRLVLVLATITVVCCNYNCPAYSAFDTFTQTGSLQSQLSGTFLVVYTSAPLVPCHRATYVADANGAITGRIRSPGCCVYTDNFNFTSTALEYDIGPVPSYVPNCPSLVQESGSMKLVATTGSGSSLCIIVAVCQPDYYGLSVMCRGSPPLLLSIQILLLNLLGDLGLIQALALRSVDQDCSLPSNTCP